MHQDVLRPVRVHATITTPPHFSHLPVAEAIRSASPWRGSEHCGHSTATCWAVRFILTRSHPTIPRNRAKVTSETAIRCVAERTVSIHRRNPSDANPKTTLVTARIAESRRTACVAANRRRLKSSRVYGLFIVPPWTTSDSNYQMDAVGHINAAERHRTKVMMS